MHYTQKYLLDKIQNMEWQHNKLMMPLIKRVVSYESAMQQVRELHTKVITLCNTCEELYPCATIRALDGEL